jgi:hypothetical protein|tara:strand:+ start:567 stop:713 length:147 start_codon:yes stop_codon:yes gene_type:complete
MVKYKLVHKDGSVSYRDTKKELLALLKKRRKNKETGWRLRKNKMARKK